MSAEIVPLGRRFHVTAQRGCVLFCTVTDTREGAQEFAATVERLTDYEPLHVPGAQFGLSEPQ